MKALVLAGTRATLNPDYPAPTLNPATDALIQVRQAGLCHTDIELVKGYMGFAGVLGHEFVGDVVACPSAPQWVGQRVCADINAACALATSPNHCDTCGHPHHCPNRTVVGIEKHDGAFAEQLVVPVANLYSVPANVSDDSAVFTEPLAAAFEILEQLTLTPTTKVVVQGDGKLGLLIAQVMRLASNHVWLVGRHPDKLAKATAWGGIQTLTTDALPALGNAWADVVVEATGRAEGFEQAMLLARPRGTIVLKSTLALGKETNLALVVINELSIVGSRCGPFDKALAALAANEIEVASMIEARYPLAQAEEALAHAHRKGSLKIVLTMQG